MRSGSERRPRPIPSPFPWPVPPYSEPCTRPCQDLRLPSTHGAGCSTGAGKPRHLAAPGRRRIPRTPRRRSLRSPCPVDLRGRWAQARSVPEPSRRAARIPTEAGPGRGARTRGGRYRGHPADRGGDRRRGFERLAESASRFTSSPSFFLFCLALVTWMVIAHAVGLGTQWQVLAGDCMTAVTLLLLALLKNSELRAERAVQRELDAIAAALLEAQEGSPGRAHEELKAAIRLEQEI
ncbi:low affinity iron permease family protein [Streptomyces sp. NPDC002523]